jgi:hypothetical protein
LATFKIHKNIHLTIPVEKKNKSIPQQDAPLAYKSKTLKVHIATSDLEIYKMNKQEASAFLKELLIKCNLESNSYVLLAPNPKDTLSAGYKIRIKTILDGDRRQQLKEISKKYDLVVVEEHSQIIVYKPKSNHFGNLILK